MWTSKTKGPPLVSHESILFLSDLCSVSLSPLLSLESNEAFRSSRLLSPAQFAGGRRCRQCSSSLTSFLCTQASLALAWSLRGKGRPALQASLRHQPCPAPPARPALPARGCRAGGREPRTGARRDEGRPWLFSRGILVQSEKKQTRSPRCFTAMARGWDGNVK